MTITEEDLARVANSRFKVQDAPTELPGTCGVCGSARTDDRRYVEFGLRIPIKTGDIYHPNGEGRLYLCTFCLESAADTIGLVRFADVKSLEAVRAEAEEILVKARAIVEGELIDSYRDLLERHADAIRSLFPNLSSVASERTEGRDEAVNGSEQGTVDSPKQSNSVISSEGRNDLPSHSGNGDTTNIFTI